jgi:hypothetical protein
MSRLHPSRIFVMPGGKYQVLNTTSLKRFLADHPEGILLHSRTSRHIRIVQSSGRIEGMEARFDVDFVSSIKSITLYDYAIK